MIVESHKFPGRIKVKEYFENINVKSEIGEKRKSGNKESLKINKFSFNISLVWFLCLMAYQPSWII